MEYGLMEGFPRCNKKYRTGYQQKYAKKIINNREPEPVQDGKHSRRVSVDNDDFSDESHTADFSLDLGNIRRFNLIGCHGISGWGGSFSNSSSVGNLFTKENEQWHVARPASRNTPVPYGFVLKPGEEMADVLGTMTLLLGDNFYSDGLGYKKWFSNFDSATSKTFNYNFTRLPYGRSYAILGNHDWGLWSHSGSQDAEYKLKLAHNQVNACYDKSEQTHHWNMPYRYYHFTTAKADFYCIDSSSFPYDGAQQEWLKKIYNLQQQKKKVNGKFLSPITQL